MPDRPARLEPPVVTFGEALVAGVPAAGETLDVAGAVRLFPGGAELNFAVGLARLGVPAQFVGRVGDDPLGRMVGRRLAEAGVDDSALSTTADGRPTGLYLRECLSDGARRPYYYRSGSAGAALESNDVAGRAAQARWLHATGITPALGPDPRHATLAAVEAARGAGVPVSFDANYRPALWGADAFCDFVVPLLPQLQVLLMGEEESELLLGTGDPAAALDRARRAGVGLAVLRLGARGAAALGEDGDLVRAESPALARDPVGAGDAFDAGFVAGLLSGASVADGLALGTYCGARVVEWLGEHEGFPRREELPDELVTVLGGDVA
ncbi:MAG TPA: sugar kinase [Acidimicrobiales bacterium]|nr:sugar kinase [Acidimicrobiales bacterium]